MPDWKSKYLQESDSGSRQTKESHKADWKQKYINPIATSSTQPKQSTFQEDRDAIERGFHQQAVEQIAPTITQNYQQHMAGLQNVINQTIGGQKQPTTPTDYKQQLEQKKQEYHQALTPDTPENRMDAAIIEEQVLPSIPGVGGMVKAIKGGLTQVAEGIVGQDLNKQSLGGLERVGKIAVGAMSAGFQAIPAVAGMTMATDLAVPVVKGQVTKLTNEQVGKVAGTLTELGIGGLISPKILIGMLASKGSTTVADKLVEGTSLTDSQKQLVSELVGQTAFFAGMAKGGKLIESGKNAISEWATADELPQFTPKGLDASNIREVGETKGTPTIVPQLRADGKSIAVVNNAKIELTKARENGTKFDEAIITKNIDNVKDPIQQAKLGQLYTDALQHNRELSQKGQSSATETKEPATSEIPVEQGKTAEAPKGVVSEQQPITDRPTRIANEVIDNQVNPENTVQEQQQIAQDNAIGISHSALEEQSIKYGTSPLYKEAQNTWKENWDAALDKDADILIGTPQEIVDKTLGMGGYVPTEIERAVLARESIKLYNRILKIDETLKTASEGDRVRLLASRDAVVDILSPIEESLYVAGSRAGSGLNFQKTLVDLKYHLVSQKRRFEALSKDGELSPEINAKLEDINTRLKETESKLATANEKLAKVEFDKQIKKAKLDEQYQVRKGNRESKLQASKDIRANLLQQMAKKMGTLNAGINPEQSVLVAKYARELIKEGYYNIEDLVDKTITDIRESIPNFDIDRRGVLDALSGAGHRTIKQLSEYQQDLSNLKTQARLIGEIYDAQDRIQKIKNAQPEEKIGEIKYLEYRKKVVELENRKTDLQKQIETLRIPEKTKKPEVSKEAKIKSLEKEIKILEKQARLIAKEAGLTKQIVSGKIVYSQPKKYIPENAEIAQLEKNIKQKQKFIRTEINERGLNAEEKYQSAKARIDNQINEIQDKIDNGIFEDKEAPKQKALDPRLFADKQKLKKIREEYDKLYNKEKYKQLSFGKKFADFTVKWGREAILSSVGTFEHLTGAAVLRTLMMPIEQLAGVPIGMAFPKVLAKSSGRYGKFSPSIEARAFAFNFTKEAMHDRWEIFKTGKQDIDVFSPHPDTSPEMTAYMGRLHYMMKSSVKKAEFQRSYAYRAQKALDSGLDPSQPQVSAALSLGAYMDSEGAILMQDNAFVKQWQNWLRGMERGTGGTKTIAYLAKQTLPIVKVPSNLLAETLEYNPVIAAGKIGLLLKRGVENMTPDQADTFFRVAQKGAVGTAVTLWAIYNHDKIGEYWQLYQKHKEGDLKPGDVKLHDVTIPAQMLRAAFMEHALFTASMINVYEKYRLKDEPPADAFAKALFSGSIGLIKRSPFLDAPSRAIDAIKTPEQGFRYAGDLVGARLVPAVVTQIGKQFDKDAEGNAVKHYPDGFFEGIEARVPGLMNKISTEKKKGTSHSSSIPARSGRSTRRLSGR